MVFGEINGSWGTSIFGDLYFGATSRSPGREIFAEPGECHIDDPIRLGCGTQQLMGFFGLHTGGQIACGNERQFAGNFPIYLGFS